MARLEQHVTGLDVLADGRDVLPDWDGFVDRHLVAGGLGVFDHHDGVGPVGEGLARLDARGLVLADPAARVAEAHRRPGGRPERIGGPDGVTVHRGPGVVGDVPSGRNRLGEPPAVRGGDGDRLGPAMGPDRPVQPVDRLVEPDAVDETGVAVSHGPRRASVGL